MKYLYMKTLSVFIVVCASAAASFAQNDPQYSQYIFNQLVINPAYAGSKEVTNLNALGRKQWSGIDGAPYTQTVSLDGPILNKHAGLGLTVMNDRSGAVGKFSFYGSYAHKIRFGKKAVLSMGLSFGGAQYIVDGSKLHTDESGDPSIPLGMQRSFKPDAKGGLFFHTNDFYFGVSATELLSTRYNKKDPLFTLKRHYFITSGLLVKLSDKIKFKPSFMVKEDFNSPTNIDLNAFFLFSDKLWLGGSYRMGVQVWDLSLQDALQKRDAVAMMAEYFLTDKFRVGYAYDLTVSALKNYGSHELSLGYYFFKKQDTKMLSPRYF
jgi:type IX secretion system PorP/SprF family membrane protein